MYIDSYLGLSKVAQSEVKSAQVVEDLRGNIGLHFLLQDTGGCAVRRQCSLYVGLLQDLSQLDPRLHIIWVLLCHLLQMSLENKDSEMYSDMTIQSFTLDNFCSTSVIRRANILTSLWGNNLCRVPTLAMSLFSWSSDVA